MEGPGPAKEYVQGLNNNLCSAGTDLAMCVVSTQETNGKEEPHARRKTCYKIRNVY